MLYSPERRTLHIVFRGSRGTYLYFDVSAEEWREFRAAASKGTYLNSVFKARHPRYERVLRLPTALRASLSASREPRDSPDENVWGFHES
jgi:hypothetical protein